MTSIAPRGESTPASWSPVDKARHYVHDTATINNGLGAAATVLSAFELVPGAMYGSAALYGLNALLNLHHAMRADDSAAGWVHYRQAGISGFQAGACILLEASGLKYLKLAAAGLQGAATAIHYGMAKQVGS